MKKSILILFTITLFTSCSEKVYLFNAKISSIDINGTKKYVPKSTAKTSILIKDPILTSSKHEYLGRLISANHIRTDNGFFDFIFLKGDYGLLDKAYITFLEEYSIPKFLSESTDINTSFKTDFNEEGGYQNKKQVLFMDKYKSIREIMEKSTYQEISNNIKQAQKIQSTFKSGLTANIETVVKESDIEFSGELKAKLESLVKDNVDINGKYIDIELVKQFSDKIKDLLFQLRSAPAAPENAFLRNYIAYFKSNGDFVAVGYALLQFEITYKTSKITTSEIELVLDGVAELTEAQKTNISAKVYSSFSYSRDFKGEAKSKKNYLIRYAYDNSIQQIK
jgi:hypothetical protein